MLNRWSLGNKIGQTPTLRVNKKRTYNGFIAKGYSLSIVRTLRHNHIYEHLCTLLNGQVTHKVVTVFCGCQISFVVQRARRQLPTEARSQNFHFDRLFNMAPQKSNASQVRCCACDRIVGRGCRLSILLQRFLFRTNVPSLLPLSFLINSP